MEELIEKIGSDPILMLSSAIAVVVLIFVVLVVVVASMRVKTYKDRFVNLRADNEEKEKRIVLLENELQEIKIRNAQNEQALEQFSDTKNRLAHTETLLSESRQELGQIQNLQAQTQTQLDNTNMLYESLQEEHRMLKERLDTLNEENSKLRINNARLLMKLETEEHLERQRALSGRTGKETS
jgi:chromosome segregation ATPase